MSLKPFDVTNNETEIPQELNNILQSKGIDQDSNLDTKRAPVSEHLNKNERLKDARAAFNRSRGDIHHAASVVSAVLNYSKHEHLQLKAAEMILKVQGILDEIEDKKAPIINVTVNQFSPGENKSLINLVVPIP